MIITPYDKTKSYDFGAEFLCKMAKKACFEKDNDMLTLVVGKTGSGKSNLGLWLQYIYMGDEADIKLIALTRKSFADGLKYIKSRPQPRFLMYDEANVSKRDSLASWNKEIIDLYLSIRGKNIWHLWNNPSLDYIDKQFIKERVTGVIYVRGQNRDGRFYYYYKQKDILAILDKYDNLYLDTIDKVRDRYAFFRGWFNEYNGPLKQKYLEMKENRMDEKIDLFAEKYGSNEGYGFQESARMLKVHYTTLRKYFDEGLSNGEIIQGSDFYISCVGKYILSKELLEKLRIKMIDNQNRYSFRKKVIFNGIVPKIPSGSEF